MKSFLPRGFRNAARKPWLPREPARIRSFLLEQGEIILKPLDGMGGTSIFRLRQGDPNLSVILETMTEYNSSLCDGAKIFAANCRWR